MSKIEIDIPQDFFDVIRIIVKEELESLLKNTTFNSLNNLQLKDRYLNVKEAAELFQVSDKTIRTYIGEGMPHVRIGQQIRLNKHEILNWFTTNSRN
ncbi:helix-turn-helix domain-containing protein [Paenibacillus sp. FSL K6-1230]